MPTNSFNFYFLSMARLCTYVAGKDKFAQTIFVNTI